MEWNGMEWKRIEWNGMEKNRMEWNGKNRMEWKRIEWDGMEKNGIEGMEQEWNRQLLTIIIIYQIHQQCYYYMCELKLEL